MTRRLFIALLWVVAASTVAATTYRTQRLSQIAGALHLSLPAALPSASLIDSVAVVNGHAVHLRTGRQGEVSHIGYDMFAPAVVLDYGQRPLLEFLERYLLELDLNISHLSKAERLDVDGVTVVSGTLSTLRRLTPSMELSMQVEERTRRLFRVSFVVGGEEVRITIPADCQLLLGANAIELEQLALREIPLMPLTPITDSTTVWAAEPADVGDSLYVVGEGQYMSSFIRSDIWLTRKGHVDRVLCSLQHPTKSVSNMMLTGVAPHSIPLTLMLNEYGGRTDTLRITVQQFVNFCREGGCRLYFGIKEVRDGVLSGSLFAYHERMAFTHMLRIDFPMSVLQGEGAEARGTAYVFIPMRYFSDAYFKNDFIP